MSFLTRFHASTSHLSETSVPEHQAVVELLALAAYADDAVSDSELEELSAFDAGHASWDEAGFSVLQHLPVALAHARYGSTFLTEVRSALV